MDYKTILLQLDESPRRAERIAFALRLAEAFGAHLTARFTLNAALLPTYAMAEAGAAAVQYEEEARAEAAAKAEGEFRAAASRSPTVSSEWRNAQGDVPGDPAAAARCVDLVVAGQPDPDAALQRMAAGDLLLSAGRPVLFVPYAGRFPSVGRRVLVAWNDSRESARAVADALPFLRKAQSAHVVRFETGRLGAPAGGSASDIAVHLARHGVKVQLGAERIEDIEVGEQILSRAADLDIDLIVMGAYGHSRVRESVLGGATRTLLDSMTVPTLMSH
jgi:nucleotide-binding universal stress UspA family protein